MKQAIIVVTFSVLLLASCNNNTSTKQTMSNNGDSSNFKSGYADVNGINMYYEIHGQGQPLVLLHGGGSTIETTFGRVIPLFAKDRQVIAVELQAHGRTGDRDADLSFEHDADDLAALLKHLNIQKADILGFSNGGNTALQIAIRHPELCGKIVAGSPLLKRDGTWPQFWEFMDKGTFDQMPQQYKDAYLKVTPDSARLMNMFQKCAKRMINLKDFPDQQIKSIKAPVLLINGDADVATSEHIVSMSRLIPNCKLAIIPGGHGEYLGEITTLKPGYKESDFAVALIEKFLE